MNHPKIDLKFKNYQSNNAALVWQKESLSYYEYIYQIFSIANTLRLQGVSEGSHVGIIVDIDQRFPILFFALLQLKSTVIPVNERLPNEEITQLLNQANCDFIISFDETFIPSALLDMTMISLSDIFNLSRSYHQDELDLNLSLDQRATILFTSGSSGKAKAVVHSLENHYYSALGSNTNITFARGDKWLIVLPFYHVAGIAILFRAFMAGGTIVIGSNDLPIYDQLKNHCITHLSLVPTQLYRLLKSGIDGDTMKHLKAVLIGGSNCSQSLINEALNKNLPLFISYGSTEMSSQITTTKPNENLNHAITSGHLLPYRELKISNEREILVKGKTLAKGYLANKKLRSIIDNEGWYHTGDLGYMDEKGKLVLLGRKDNMFISAGENIYPEEIENALLMSDAIVDACVVAIADNEYGRRPVAFLKMRINEGIDEKALTQNLRKQINVIKIPIRFFEWPVNDDLKADRKKLQILAEKMVGAG